MLQYLLVNRTTFLHINSENLARRELSLVVQDYTALKVVIKSLLMNRYLWKYIDVRMFAPRFKEAIHGHYFQIFCFSRRCIRKQRPSIIDEPVARKSKLVPAKVVMHSVNFCLYWYYDVAVSGIEAFVKVADAPET